MLRAEVAAGQLEGPVPPRQISYPSLSRPLAPSVLPSIFLGSFSSKLSLVKINETNEAGLIFERNFPSCLPPRWKGFMGGRGYAFFLT